MLLIFRWNSVKLVLVYVRLFLSIDFLILLIFVVDNNLHKTLAFFEATVKNLLVAFPVVVIGNALLLVLKFKTINRKINL